MRFDLTDMRVFLSVVECGSLTQGAQAIHLALASVSERIAGMEAALGAQLLERNRRGVPRGGIQGPTQQHGGAQQSNIRRPAAQPRVGVAWF